MATYTVTLLMSSGDPDPTWTLDEAQAEAFIARVAASDPSNTVHNPPTRRPGYAGIMVRTGGGERWVVFRGWIYGAIPRVDERRVLEQWLLDTGAGTVPSKLAADLTRQITPPA